MAFCTYCGSSLHEGCTYCTTCGKPILSHSQSRQDQDLPNEAYDSYQGSQAESPEATSAFVPHAVPTATAHLMPTTQSASQPLVKRRSNALPMVVGILAGCAIVFAALGYATNWFGIAGDGQTGSTSGEAASSQPFLQGSSEDDVSPAGAAAPGTSSHGSNVSSSSPMQQKEEKPLGAQPPKFSNFTASSSSRYDGIDDYRPTSAGDDNPQTAWNSNGELSPDGIGQWLEMSSSDLQHVTSVSIMAGFCKSEDVWAMNRRPRHITLSFSDGTFQSFELSDVFSRYQDLKLAKPVDTTFVRMTIDSTYSPTHPSERYDDVAVSEMRAS